MSVSQQHPPLTVQIQERAQEALTHTGHAVTSLAWLWPLKGIAYAISHPKLFTSIRPALLKSLLSSSLVLLFLLFFTYLPQLAFLALFTGPFAPLIALFLVLAESLLALTFLAKPLFLGPALTGVFDAVLIERGQRELVLSGRRRVGGGGAGKEVGRAMVSPLQGFTYDGVVRYLVTLPVNFVPVIGSVVFVLFNGSRQGPTYHARYFQLKGLTKAQRQEFVEKRRPEYTAFGTTTMILNFIPLVGLVFSFTNSIGAALWAAELEARENLIDGPGPVVVGKVNGRDGTEAVRAGVEPEFKKEL
ncbi:hypothetical protein JAAARDRAFT_128429 [Jaapia argillacea MUCL 33604]|uniref:Outer spore wall protein RRT8 n=1 Tax=Jaapia argillacea MUCL 33604 TaxID=933084 RepID=A0A067PU69_9AGAM|nr:hypothetical protein JAAARDRAFT_128429 [Jaapia argillacea MUCL 33604]